MAYSVKNKKHGKPFFLHSRRQALKGGHVQTIYFFASQEKEGAVDTLPSGYVVSENVNTGLPFLKKNPDFSAVGKASLESQT